MNKAHDNGQTVDIHLPAPTAWPFVMGLGIALMLTALVTNMVLGVLGVMLLVVSAIGWFMQVLPHEAHETLTVSSAMVPISSTRTVLQHTSESSIHRRILPYEHFRFTTGLRGGLAGGLAMTVPAALYGILRYHSVWYAANLLAAGGFTDWAGASNQFLSQFHIDGLMAAIGIHIVVSALVGLLYGALLPMFPRYPILTAGFMAPLLFTGIMYSAIGVVSPILNERIDWFWFVASQLCFGLVCGYVVNLHARIRTSQFQALPFLIRAGIEANRGNRESSEDKSE
ncbi:MAG: hypothetical protein KGN79_15660 [Acidobacteriota bacterium]|nr:hypothetical protein [Acidobacteriota bacterium]